MKKYILDKNTSKRIAALVMAGVLTVSGITLTGCGKKDAQNAKSDAQIQMEKSFELTKNGIKSLFPTMNEDVVKNAALILMLDEIAKEDENGKISSEAISYFKTKVDSDNMMADFNSFLDTLEQTMIEQETTLQTNSLVADADCEIISNLESITQNIITGDAETKKSNFNIIYKLFVEEEKVNVNGLDIEIRNLTYPGRAVAEAYARTCAYYARNYITDAEYTKLDERTNSQNNKAYIKTKLEILNNQKIEKSEVKVVEVFNIEYEETANELNGKVNVSNENVETLVNILNLEYLNSDRVANKDKEEVLGEYSDENVSNAFIAVDAITKYNETNSDSVLFSSMLISKYKMSETGKLDKLALDYIQYNVMNLLKTTNSGSTFNEVYGNGYFKNIYKALTKQSLECKYSDGTTVIINYQDLSDGAKAIINEIVVYVVNARPALKSGKGFEEKAKSNLQESVQYIQNVILGECKKATEFVK